ncbi:MAG: hypothetical protein ACE5OO_02195 [Candidatus Bathyarchaeia archaeon]
MEGDRVPPCSVFGKVFGGRITVGREGERIVFFVLVEHEWGEMEYYLPMSEGEAGKLHDRLGRELEKGLEAGRMVT